MRGDGGRHGCAYGLSGLGDEVLPRAVGHDGEDLGAFVEQLRDGERGDLSHLVGRARHRRAELLGLTLCGASSEHEQDRGAEVRGDARVVGEFRGAADVGVVAADDHDRVALRLDRLVALDDRRQGRVGVSAHVVVGGSDAVVVGEIDAVVREQHLEHVVALLGRPCDRAEDPHPRGRMPQGLEDSEGDGGLAGVPLGGCDVDALRHAPSLEPGIAAVIGVRWMFHPADSLSTPYIPTGKERLSANPAEPGYPCYVSVLGELAWMPPRGELSPV